MARKIEGQIIGSFVENFNNSRDEKLKKCLNIVQEEALKKLNIQDQNLKSALLSVNEARNFLTTPQNILGSEATKHGEIAEQIEVGISNARRLIKGLESNATFENVARTAPEDYIKAGVQVQSKFINSANGTLNSVIKHMEKYEYFGRDSSYYEIPKDYYETLLKVYKGETIQEMKIAAYENLQKKIREIEIKSGKDFLEVVKPGISKYRDVQINVAEKTLDKHQKDIMDINKAARIDIKRKAKFESEEITQKIAPNLNENLKISGTAAAVSGGLDLTIKIYEKRKKKDFSQFDIEDWQEIGLSATKESIRGGVTGFSIYQLTNYGKIKGPVATAYVSVAFGITKLLSQYHSNEINFDKFIEQSEVLCFESGAVMLGAIVGQTCIPVPVLGSVLGSIIASTITSVCKDKLNKKEYKYMMYLRNQYENATLYLDSTLRKVALEIYNTYKSLDDISVLAFSYSLNSAQRFECSKKLALAHGVSEENILKNEKEIDNYFM